MKYVLILLVWVLSAVSAYSTTLYYVPDTTITLPPPPDTNCTNEGYPNCETCPGAMGTGVPWGAIQSVSFPMALLPDLVMPCGPIPGCTMTVYFKKRMCGDTIHMKVCGFKFTGCTANQCRCKMTLLANPVAAFLWYAVGPPFMNNSFNLFDVTPFEWKNVKILSYTCYGVYDNLNSCSPLYVIPCKEYACCEYTLRVTSDPDCGTIGFVAAWRDVSGVPGWKFGMDRVCEVCQRKTNHKPTKPYPDGNPDEEYVQIAKAMGVLNLTQIELLFNKNGNSTDNTCVYSCPDLQTLDKTWYVKNGNLIPINIGRKQKRRR